MSREVLRSLWQGGSAMVGSFLAVLARKLNGKLAAVSADLVNPAVLFIPTITPRLLPTIQAGSRRAVGRTPVPSGIRVMEHVIEPSAQCPGIRVIAVDKPGPARPRPALLWFHGGGYVLGAPEMDLPLLGRMLATFDGVVFSVDYRLAPQDPFPAALDDGMRALRWLLDEREALGIDRSRIAVGGNSAGGGLAAALAQRATDENLSLDFQLLMYPMLDDRTASGPDHSERGQLVWTPKSNRCAWGAYLGHTPGVGEIDPYAAPARRQNLAGLPPAWIGVGTLDLFYMEDVSYAERLRAAGVPCELEVVAGAPHGFDLFKFNAKRVARFHEQMSASLSHALAPK